MVTGALPAAELLIARPGSRTPHNIHKNTNDLVFLTYITMSVATASEVFAQAEAAHGRDEFAQAAELYDEAIELGTCGVFSLSFYVGSVCA
jgi:hypothetical protein